MNTKLTSFILVFTLSFSLVFAQRTDKSRFSFAILGGANFQNLNGKNMIGDKLENDMILGYHAGVNVQIPVAPDFYFQPGLMFNTKGAKNTTVGVTNTYKLSYIELPLNFVYKVNLGGGSFMLGFGPYVGYGIAGKTIYEGGAASVESDIEFKKVVEIGDPLTTAYIKPFDAGGNIFFGYELAAGIFLQLDTQLGMININPEDKRFPDSKLSIKNTGYGLSLGYRF